MGLSKLILVMTHLISGFQQTQSRMFRAAEGVGMAYEARSTLASGRVKQAKSPEIFKRIEVSIIIFVLIIQ
jgi:hypothetical protein